MSADSVQLCINNRSVSVPAARLTDSLLNVLREGLRLTGTKEGCASGDCGACTVVVHSPQAGTHTLNSCITPAGAVLGGAVLTVEGVGSDDTLHPVQQAMIDLHGAQCGFCTPGFVMSMVGDHLVRAATPDRHDAVVSVSGNLCRCTGYRPIIEAAQAAWHDAGDRFSWLDAARDRHDGCSNYLLPTSLQELCECLTSLDGAALVLAGSTDAWLAVSQNYQDYATILDLSRVAQMRGIEQDGSTLTIGASTTHAELLEFFSNTHACTAIQHVLQLFGSPQIRARGTLGGNIGNASPIADWPPILLTLDARVHLINAEGARRSVPLDEYYLGYRQTVLLPGEVITHVECQLPVDADLFAAKVSKRTEDDISSVLTATRLATGADGTLETVRVAYGGVAATPLRLPAIEAQLTGMDLANATEDELAQICDGLDAAIQPISDVRASADYRLQMAKNGLLQALLSKQGEAPEDLQHV